MQNYFNKTWCQKRKTGRRRERSTDNFHKDPEPWRLYRRDYIDHRIYTKRDQQIQPYFKSVACEVPISHLLWCSVTEQHCVAFVSNRLPVPHPGSSPSKSAGQTEHSCWKCQEQSQDKKDIRPLWATSYSHIPSPWPPPPILPKISPNPSEQTVTIQRIHEDAAPVIMIWTLHKKVSFLNLCSLISVLGNSKMPLLCTLGETCLFPVTAPQAAPLQR